MTDHTDYKELVERLPLAGYRDVTHSKCRVVEESLLFETADAIEALQSDKAALQARVKELEGALEPFDSALEELEDYRLADDHQQAPVTAGDCRAARAALKGGA